MNRGRLTQRIVAILVGLFLLAYVAYQGYRYYREPISTETVYEYSVSRSVAGEGIVIRDEMVLPESGGGAASYLYPDATRISVQETVAEFYRSSAGDRDTRRGRELEEEIRLLREAQGTSVSPIGNTEIYNRDIKDQVSRLSVMASAGRLTGVSAVRKSLVSLVSKKLISTGKETGFAPRIAMLEEELGSLRRSGAGEILRAVKAPVSGYFSSVSDGYESRALFDLAEEYTLEDYKGMIESTETASSEAATNSGKMVLNPNWYCAVAVPKAETEWITAGRNAALAFDALAEPVPASLVKILEHNEDDTAVLLFQTDLMTEDTINLRRSGVAVHFEELTGLRIAAADLRFNDKNERGIYILDEKNTIRFRLVEPVYEEESFVLSALYYNSAYNDFVKLYDQVIVKGVDLYDGKPILDGQG